MAASAKNALKILMFKLSYVSQIFRVAVFENTMQTKTCSKLTTKKDTRTALVNVILVSLD